MFSNARGFVGLSVAALLISNIATAQDAALDEIVVTARKRVETLQDVPLAISVLSGPALQDNQIDNITDLFGRVPGLYFTSSGSVTATSDFNYLVIRGVGFNGGQEPAVGVFVDGMYQPQLGYDIDFLELERLEVLRGPQGTLFGRNTEAGAVNLVTRKPDENFAGQVSLEAGRFNTYRGLASVRGPIKGALYGALSAQLRDTDGYMENTATGRPAAPERKSAVRGALRWAPSSELEWNLSADFSQRDGSEMDYGSPLDCRCYDLQHDPRPDSEQRSFGVQLTADWKPSAALALTSITGMRSVKNDTASEFDGVQTDQTTTTANGPPGQPPITFGGDYQNVNTDQEFWSEELRLSGSSGSVEWLLGAYYFKQDQRNFAEQALGPGVVRDPALDFLVPLIDRLDFDADRHGWALFGQASWRPIERLEITAGARTSQETVKVDGSFYRNIVNIENANPNFFSHTGEEDFDNFSPTGSIAWKFANTVKGYVTVSKGWKAGGFNRYPSTDTIASLPYGAETSLNYEVGLKSAWPAARLTADLAVFYVTIDDQQLFTTTADADGVPVSTIANAGESRSQGIELELGAQPVDQLDLSLSFAYTDAKFVDFTQRAESGDFVVRDGQRFEFVPRVTGAATAEYRFGLGAERELALNASYRYTSDYIVPNGGFLAPMAATIPVDAFDRVDLRATVSVADWKIAAYVRNVLDSFDYSQIFYGGFVAQTPNNLFVTPLEPRTYGLVVSKRF